MLEEFWMQPPDRIARNLLGKSLILGNNEATILQSTGYGRSENTDNGLYRPLLEIPPGHVYCPRRRNAVLLLLAASDRGAWGGCVLIRTVEINGEIFAGPGRVTERLDIREHGLHGTTKWLNEDTILLRVEGETVPPKPPSGRKPHRVKDGNGVGPQTLERLMPRIVGAYLRSKPAGCPFRDYLNDLLRVCENAGQLRRRLAEP